MKLRRTAELHVSPRTMRLSTRKLFTQLDDRNRARPNIKMDLPWYGRFSLSHQQRTIADFAAQLHMRPQTLIEVFEQAGVRDLTPTHHYTPAHAGALLDYLRAQKHSKTTEIYRDQGSLSSNLLVVQSLNVQLLAQLAKTPKLLYQLDPRRFEELVAKLLEDQGCEVTLTKRTRDGGYDVFGRMKTGPSDVVFLAECKRYSPENKVGVELVRNLYGVTELHRANFGLLITTSTFTQDAQQEKIRIGPRISLKDYEDLKSWLTPYHPVG